MAKDKLFAKPPETDKRTPHTRFSELATRVFSTPKAEVDRREKQWQKRKKSTTR